MRATRCQPFLQLLAAILFAGGGFSALAAGIEAENAKPQDVFNGMRESFRPDKAKGIHVRYQFDLTGPHGGQWWIEVDDGKFKMARGRIDTPDVTFNASDRDWVALSNGKLNGTWAVFTGRLKVHGSQWLAHKLDEMFP
jgi:putative sterol carrier protein